MNPDNEEDRHSEAGEDRDEGQAAERREAQRVVTILRLGKLTDGSRESLCRIRNISSLGFMAEVTPQPEPGTLLALEIREGEQLPAVVVWCRQETIGARFLAPQVVEQLLAKEGRSGAERVRPVRISTDVPVSLRIGGRYLGATIENISQTGLKLTGDELLVTGTDVVITAEGLGVIKGVVRWSREGRAGISFYEPLSYEMLAHWLWLKANPGQAARSGAAGGPRQE